MLRLYVLFSDYSSLFLKLVALFNVIVRSVRPSIVINILLAIMLSLVPMLSWPCYCCVTRQMVLSSCFSRSHSLSRSYFLIFVLVLISRSHSPSPFLFLSKKQGVPWPRLGLPRALEQTFLVYPDNGPAARDRASRGPIGWSLMGGTWYMGDAVGWFCCFAVLLLN